MDGGKFFGAFRACCGITDAVVLNHTPIGCSWGAGMLRTTSNQLDLRHACTVMHEREIVFGGETSLQEALKRVDALYQSPLIIIAVGDVPSIIGDNIEAIISTASLKKPVIWVDAAGFKGSMRRGYEEALIRLAPLMNECPIVERSVNIIGFCPDDFKADADIKEIKRMLMSAGIKINSIISNCPLDQFKNAPAAELNLVLGQGIDLCQWMEKNFGLPYVICDYPYGLESSKKLIDTVCDRLGLGIDSEKEIDMSPFKKIFLWLNELVGTPVSVIGDFRASSLADYLHNELGLELEVVSTFEDDYYAFEQKVRGSNSSMLFGSSFEKNLAKELGIPLIRYSYPVFDQVSIYEDSPYAGLRGALNLTEEILNTVLGFGCNSKYVDI